MTFSGAFEIVLTLALTVVAVYPIIAYVADVLDNRRTFPHSNHRPARTVLYRFARVESDVEQEWHEYAIAMVLFGGICMFGLCALVPVTRLAAPQSARLSGRVARLGVCIAISFITNANWQA
jgi:K+-transporting ATPase A subunit